VEPITQKFVQRVLELNREASLCEPRKYLYSTKTISLGNWRICEPGSMSIVTNHRHDPDMKIRVTFKVEGEAKAFAQEFGGSLLDTPWATNQVIVV
jgi:hypothetical protein